MFTLKSLAVSFVASLAIFPMLGCGSGSSAAANSADANDGGKRSETDGATRAETRGESCRKGDCPSGEYCNAATSSCGGFSSTSADGER